MDINLKLLERTFRYGATAQATLATGQVLGPRLIDYLRVDPDADHMLFKWIGEEEHFHGLTVEQARYEGDGAFTFLGDKKAILIEPIWSPDDRLALTEWARNIHEGRLRGAYPQGGWRYADV